MIATYPSPELPGPASLSVDLPNGWAAHVSPEFALVALGPEDPGRFRPNLCVSLARVSAQRSIGDYAAAARAELERSLDQFEGNGPDLFGELHGQPAAIREYAFVEPASGLTLFQVQAQALCTITQSVADLVTATATCAGGRAEHVEALRSIIRSLTVATA
jgi:hypothetical protein